MIVAVNDAPVLTLKSLLSKLTATDYLPEIEVQGLTLDSRKIEQGYVFVALEGQFEHGLAYAEAALSRGAVAVLCDAKFDQYCRQILSKLMSRAICIPVRNLQNKLGELANTFYGAASKNLYISGITGTDGKTSVSHFIAQAMGQALTLSSPSNQENNRVAVIGTLGNGDISNLQQSSHTTPDVFSLHAMLADYKQQGVKAISMEVSSHGLDQQRSAGIDFDVLVLTNLSRDHLDYHGNLEAYKQAKKSLFIDNKDKPWVINIDDEFGVELFAESDKSSVWLYGLNKNKAQLSQNFVMAENIVHQASGMSFLLNSSRGVSEVDVKLMGEFNVYNVLACFCVLLQSGMDFDLAIKEIKNLHTVAGRMELVVQQDKPSVVIDYAHTPEALTQALMNVRNHISGKLICVFGCGGDRDQGKRSLMAQAAEELSDLVIITNDNPRMESPEKIIDEIKQGIRNEMQLIVEEDRKKAISQAINMATSGDLVLIAGKGHEQFQVIGDKKIPFSDKQVALAALVLSDNLEPGKNQ